MTDKLVLPKLKVFLIREFSKSDLNLPSAFHPYYNAMVYDGSLYDYGLVDATLPIKGQIDLVIEDNHLSLMGGGKLNVRINNENGFDSDFTFKTSDVSIVGSLESSYGKYVVERAFKFHFGVGLVETETNVMLETRGKSYNISNVTGQNVNIGGDQTFINSKKNQ